MGVNTQRFGIVDVSASQVICFPNGILGFPRFKNYILLEPNGGSCFFWLQSTEVPGLAFVVTDPTLFFSDYKASIGEEGRRIGISDVSEASVLVIVNMHSGSLTLNLKAPLVINSTTKIAAQIVSRDQNIHTRHAILSNSLVN